MMSKKIISGLLTLFSLFLVIGFVSAAPALSLTTLSSPSSVSSGAGLFQLTFNVSYSGDEADAGNATISFASSNLVNASGVSFSPVSIFLDKNKSSTLTATVSFPSTARSSVKGTLTASNGTLSSLVNFDIPITFNPLFCKNGPVGANLSIRSIDVSNSGDKDDEWNFLDEVTIEVDVKNEGDDDIDNVFVEFALIDSSGNNLVSDLDFSNTDEEEYDLGDLGDGDKETATFEFTVPADMDSGNYDVVFKAYSDDLGESNMCAEEKDNRISIKKESDDGKFIAFTNLQLSPKEATCGDSLRLTGDAYNIGDKDQDRVKILVFNKDLGIDQFFEITRDMNEGDKERMNFDFTIPANAKDGNYNLLLSSEYDYRSGVYRQESDDDFPVTLKVIGCGTPASSAGRIASISASLDSDAVAGKPMVVTATIRNLGTSVATFAVRADNYDSWADLKDVSDETLTLNPGESKEVTLKFNVNDDASGDQSFTIEASSAGKKESREVQVSLGESSSSSLSGLFKNNSLIWVIGLVNLILIILIIVVAVKLSKR